ncbi:hypothetical protein DsansV1_C06g0066511 [Dioscorea sansibarensis]
MSQVPAKPSRVLSTTTSTTTVGIPVRARASPVPYWTVTSRSAGNASRVSDLLAQIAAAQASQPVSPASPAPVLSGPNATPLNPFPRGIPARARVSPVGCWTVTSRSTGNASVRASQTAQSVVQASQSAFPAPPAPILSGPNATLLNLFPAIFRRGLDSLRDNPQVT